MNDRFRPDAAARRVIPCATPPHPGNVPETGRLFRDHPRVGFKGLSAPTYHSEVNKDRTGKHGSEVA